VGSLRRELFPAERIEAHGLRETSESHGVVGGRLSAWSESVLGLVDEACDDLLDVQGGFIRVEIADGTRFVVIRPLRVSIRPKDGRKGFIPFLY
jgi:hypothetical protein